MRSIVYILLIFTFTTAVLSQPNWKYCQGADGSTISIDSIVVQPYPVRKGYPLKFTAKGTAVKGMTQRNGRIGIVINGSEIISALVGGSVNVDAGKPYSWSFSYSVPSNIPPGSYDINVSMMDTDFNRLTCVSWSQTF